jgi:putative DNA methylase
MVACPNPACGIETPLVRSWWLGTKKGRETYVIPSVVGDPTHPSGLRIKFELGRGAGGPKSDGTMSGRFLATRLSARTTSSPRVWQVDWELG